ncbi:MAG: protein kinase [Gemmataceae bacterium]|nr:protein kinase [Gemmataceae bacterium]
MSSTTVGVESLFDLIERSGLLSADQLAPYRADPGPDADALCRTLIRDRLLTPFQARQLLRGRHRGFFLTEKYKVLDHIGEGGMGRVLLCEHLLLHRLMAVKMLHVSSVSVPGAEERFLREARAAAAVDHPNIVHVYDVDRTGSTPFMVMEYVDGTNLHQLVAQGGPLAVDRAVEYVRQAAVGLHHAHRAGLVHRDIKPGNLLLDRAGTVKVLDLGLARFNVETGRNDNLTQKFDAASILGTADFVAPEQTMNSSRVDIRADLYSLGIAFYYLLTGKMPFADGTPAQKILWHQSRDPVPVAELRPGVPAAVAEVLERMIRKDPADRFQNPAEVVVALRPLVTAPVPPPRPEEMPKVRATAYPLAVSPPPTPGLFDPFPTPPVTPPRIVGETPSALKAPTTPATVEHRPPAGPGYDPPPTEIRPTPAVLSSPITWTADVPKVPLAVPATPAPIPPPAEPTEPAERPRQTMLAAVAAAVVVGVVGVAIWAATRSPDDHPAGDPVPTVPGQPAQKR